MLKKINNTAKNEISETISLDGIGRMTPDHSPADRRPYGRAEGV